MFIRTVKILAATLTLCTAISLGTDAVSARNRGGHGGGAHHAGRAHFSGGGGRHVRGGAHHTRSFRGARSRSARNRSFRGARSRSARIRSFRGGHIRQAYRNGSRGFRSGHNRRRRALGRSFGRTHAFRRGFARVNGTRVRGLRAAALGAGAAWKHSWNHWGNPYWRGGWNGGWGGWSGWVGPVFWPYVYGDLLSFVFWPRGYYYPLWFDPFWAYTDIFLWDAIFWPGPSYGPYYADAPEYYDVYGDYAYSDPVRRQAAREAGPSITGSIGSTGSTSDGLALAQICSGLAPGITDLPDKRIEKSLHLTDEQVTTLDALKAASSRASDALKASCSGEMPLTPVGRLDTLRRRLDGMIEALEIIRTPLDNFYNSLDEEQRQAFAKLGPGTRRHRGKSAPTNDLAALCSHRTESFTQLPIQRIEQVIKPIQEQQDALDRLKAASTNAANQLQASCPSEVPQGPIARFDAVSTRLDAMSAAIETVRPALASFYASLTDEQKARFNILGPPKTRASSSR